MQSVYCVCLIWKMVPPYLIYRFNWILKAFFDHYQCQCQSKGFCSICCFYPTCVGAASLNYWAQWMYGVKTLSCSIVLTNYMFIQHQLLYESYSSMSRLRSWMFSESWSKTRQYGLRSPFTHCRRNLISLTSWWMCLRKLSSPYSIWYWGRDL